MMEDIKKGCYKGCLYIVLFFASEILAMLIGVVLLELKVSETISFIIVIILWICFFVLLRRYAIQRIRMKEEEKEEEERERQERMRQEYIRDFRLRYLVDDMDDNENDTSKDEDSQDEDSQEEIIKSRNHQVWNHSPMEELDSMVGLSRVKEEITTLTNFIKMKQKRDEMNLKSPTISYHCVFSGNPGTGKTTVARIIAEIYRNMGVLRKGHLVETDRSGLVAEYVGQTAVKTNKVVDSALDGVLFIDEAYTLAQGGNEDYGREAIATLLKRMEDDRDRLVVILAGYTNEIEQFIDSNPGLRSRFNRYIHFDDYTAEELYEIFCLQVKKSEYVLAEDASQYLKERLAAVVADKPKDFGNARYVRNLFEKTIEAQSNRLASKAELSKDDLTLITKEDLQFEDSNLSAKTEQHSFRIKKRPIEQKKDIYIDKVEKKTMTGNKPSDLNLLGNISSVDNSFEIHDDCDETIEVSYSVIGYDDFSDNTFEMNIKERDYNWLTDKEDDGEYLDSDFVSENRHGLHKRILWAIHKNMEDESEIDLPELIDDDDIEYTLSCL